MIDVPRAQQRIELATLSLVKHERASVQPRDVAWASAAVLAAVAMVLSVLSRLGHVLMAEGWGERAMSIVFVVVGLAFWGWIAAGAWRRTVWGAQSGKARETAS